MPINPDYQSKLQKFAEIVAIEAGYKLSYLLNRNAKVNFQKLIDSVVLEGKFITKSNCFLLTSTLENPELGSVNILSANDLVQCISDLVMGGDGVVTKEADPDDTNQSVYENSAAALVDSVIERLNTLKEDLGLKVKEHKQKRLLKSKSSSLEIPNDLKDPVALSFSVKVSSKIESIVSIELSSAAINYILESLAAILDEINVVEFDTKIKAEYASNATTQIPIEEEEAASPPVSTDDANKIINPERNLDVLRDINMDLIVELGRTQMSMKEILKLAKGSAIELDRSTNQSVDLYVHNQLVARGEIIAVDECFGLKVTEVLANKF